MKIKLGATSLNLSIIDANGHTVAAFSSPGYEAEADVAGLFTAIHAIEALLRTQRDKNALSHMARSFMEDAMQRSADAVAAATDTFQPRAADTAN